MIRTREPKVIHDVGEVPLVLHSDVRAPLASLSFLRRALVLAELAMIAYNDEPEAQRAARAIGFAEAQLIDRDGSQAYRFRNDHDVVVACRGTQPTEWNDIRADANAALVVVGTLGRVHCGFNHEVDDLWPVLEHLLRENALPVWFCGHSLGGAMATICAYRCKTSAIASNPQELHTFGSPRVGCKRYIRHTAIKHYRWVHNNDIVTRVPPTWMGYRHGVREVYLDRNGKIRNLTGGWLRRDRWLGLIAGLLSSTCSRTMTFSSTSTTSPRPSGTRSPKLRPLQPRRSGRIVGMWRRIPTGRWHASAGCGHPGGPAERDDDGRVLLLCGAILA